MKVVFATGTSSVSTPNGGLILVMEGTHWSADDAVVRAHPDLFSDDPRHGMLFSHPLSESDYPGGQPPVEQATAVPGDRRNVQRRG